ncbi:MAG TPA: VWA domain-containing protein [Vicinamibacteria bacterium]|nr:VWA domain-containing protein [Vicinamibacteria bacterium]
MRALRRALASALVLAMMAVAATAVRGEDPLATADLVRFLRAGISERIILAELRDRGFGEPLDSAREMQLRDVGASETLIVAVRRVAPASPPASPAAPGSKGTGGASTPPDVSGFPTATSRVHGPTFSASTRTVRVPVSVLDKTGHPVMGLRGEDFQVQEDGKKQEVTYFSGERKPLRLALALDVSASMQNKIREVEAALRHFIDLLEPEDEILVLLFNDHVDVVQDFTSDRGRLGHVLNMLEPAGATALFDAAKEAIERVAPGPAESKAVVLVTDGMDTVSATSWGELRELARRSEVPVFSIGLGSDFTFRSIFSGPAGPIGGGRIPGSGPGRGPRGWPGGGGGGGRGGWPGGGGGGWPRGPVPGSSSGAADFDASALLDLAEETGARAEVLKGLDRDRGNVDRLKDAVESIAMTLRHRYLVGYDPATGKRGWRKIKVDVDRPQVTARARKGYYSEG